MTHLLGIKNNNGISQPPGVWKTEPSAVGRLETPAVALPRALTASRGLGKLAWGPLAGHSLSFLLIHPKSISRWGGVRFVEVGQVMGNGSLKSHCSDVSFYQTFYPEDGGNVVPWRVPRLTQSATWKGGHAASRKKPVESEARCGEAALSQSTLSQLVFPAVPCDMS